jgi:hypothetical protein
MISVSLVCPVFSQVHYIVSGSILDKKEQQPIQQAVIFLPEQSSGTISDSVGHFSVLLAPGVHRITISYLGYSKQDFKFNVSRDTMLRIEMESNHLMKDVVVLERKKEATAQHDANGLITLRREDINALPALLGEHDPIRAVQMQPGVQSGNEGTRGVFVRGGSPDQNLMLIDGSTVYNPSHLYGFISVFNSDAIEKMDVHKNSFPASFGGRLGSVMSIETANGNGDKIQGAFSLGLITSKFNIGGPLDRKKKTLFSLSLRGCYVGAFTGPISKRQFKAAGYDGSIAYYFGDVNFKLVHQFSKKDAIELNYFSNYDYYSFTKNVARTKTSPGESTVLQTVRWANYVSSIHWLHTFNNRLTLRTAFSFSDYELNSENKYHYSSPETQYSSAYNNYYNLKSTAYIRDYALRSILNYAITKQQTFKAGVEIKGLFFETGKGKEEIDNTWYGQKTNAIKGSETRAIEASCFVEDEYSPNKHWTINAGFHFRTYTVQQKTFTNLLPRISIVYSPIQSFSLRASASGLSQNIHLLVASTSNILNDYWVPATTKAAPEIGWNFSGGMLHKLPLFFEWSVDGFYRTMNHLIEYKEGANYFSRSWESQVIADGKGVAYGMEVYLARTYGRLTGSVAYTLSWSKRKFSLLNNGEYFPYKYDRRHNVAFQMNYNISKHIAIGLSWVYGSGNMISVSNQSYNTWSGVLQYDNYVKRGNPNPGSGEEIALYSGKNNYRLPAYHHLDISFTYKKRVKRNEHEFNFSIYNVYNRLNVFTVYQDYRNDSNGNRILVYKQLSLFPILPSLTYIIHFGL